MSSQDQTLTTLDETLKHDPSNANEINDQKPEEEPKKPEETNENAEEEENDVKEPLPQKENKVEEEKKEEEPPKKEEEPKPETKEEETKKEEPKKEEKKVEPKKDEINLDEKEEKKEDKKQKPKVKKLDPKKKESNPKVENHPKSMKKEKNPLNKSFNAETPRASNKSDIIGKVPKTSEKRAHSSHKQKPDLNEIPEEKSNFLKERKEYERKVATLKARISVLKQQEEITNKKALIKQTKESDLEKLREKKNQDLKQVTTTIEKQKNDYLKNSKKLHDTVVQANVNLKEKTEETKKEKKQKYKDLKDEKEEAIKQFKKDLVIADKVRKERHEKIMEEHVALKGIAANRKSDINKKVKENNETRDKMDKEIIDDLKKKLEDLKLEEQRCLDSLHETKSMQTMNSADKKEGVVKSLNFGTNSGSKKRSSLEGKSDYKKINSMTARGEKNTPKIKPEEKEKKHKSVEKDKNKDNSEKKAIKSTVARNTNKKKPTTAKKTNKKEEEKKEESAKPAEEKKEEPTKPEEEKPATEEKKEEEAPKTEEVPQTEEKKEEVPESEEKKEEAPAEEEKKED